MCSHPLLLSSTNSQKHLAFLRIVDGVALGFHGKGAEPVTLKEILPLVPNDTALIGNCG